MGLLVHLRGPLAALAMLTLAASAAQASSELSEIEIASLHHGAAVIREQTIEDQGRRYVGGIAYIIIAAPPARVLDTLDDVSAYQRLLPATRQVRWLGMSRGGESIVQLEQGTSVVHGSYVVRTRREAHGEGNATVIRFWLDARFPHDVDDAQGYFRAEPLGDQTLLTYGAWVDLGSGVLRRLLERRVQRMVLSTPARVKTYVEALPPFG